VPTFIQTGKVLIIPDNDVRLLACVAEVVKQNATTNGVALRQEILEEDSACMFSMRPAQSLVRGQDALRFTAQLSSFGAEAVL
jgi:hypothetical protein